MSFIWTQKVRFKYLQIFIFYFLKKRCAHIFFCISLWILEENQAYKSYIRSNKSLQFLNQFQFLQTKLNSLIEESKEKSYVRLPKKFLDIQTSPKFYWSILKTLSNNKKIPSISLLLITPRQIYHWLQRKSQNV